jgi:hypothetical protein
MAYFTYRNRQVSKEKWAWSGSTDSDDIVNSSPDDYRLCNAEKRLEDHKFQDNGEVEML